MEQYSWIMLFGKKAKLFYIQRCTWRMNDAEHWLMIQNVAIRHHTRNWANYCYYASSTQHAANLHTHRTHSKCIRFADCQSDTSTTFYSNNNNQLFIIMFFRSNTIWYPFWCFEHVYQLDRQLMVHLCCVYACAPWVCSVDEMDADKYHRRAAVRRYAWGDAA